MKTENTPSESSIAKGETLELTTRFGTCSRGKCWGKYYANQKRPTGDFEWCEKSGGTLYLPGPGYYVVGSSDGFSRSAKAEFYLPSKALESAKKAHRRNEHTIEHHKEKLAESEARLVEKGNTLVKLTENVGQYEEGSRIWREQLIEERKRLIAEMEAITPTPEAPAPVGKTREQEKAEEAMLG